MSRGRNTKTSVPQPPAPSGKNQTVDEETLVLQVPEHKEEKPKKGELSLEAKLQSPIKVKAISPGFLGGVRKKSGDIFEVSNYSKVGMWMECLDEEVQKFHKERVENRDRKQREFMVRKVDIRK